MKIYILYNNDYIFQFYCDGIDNFGFYFFCGIGGEDQFIDYCFFFFYCVFFVGLGYVFIFGGDCVLFCCVFFSFNVVSVCFLYIFNCCFVCVF